MSKITKILLGTSLFLIGLGLVLKFLMGEPAQLKTAPSEAPSPIQNQKVIDQKKALEQPVINPHELENASESAQKINLLTEIFKSKNDNDPRLDSEFKNISSSLKSAMKSMYEKLPPESRNERGTLVFLLGREMKTAEELSFFKAVLSEPPCLSMADCSKADPAPQGEQVHLESLNQTSLYYPQIMALRMQEKQFLESANPEVREAALSLIKDSTKSKIGRIAQEARAIVERLGL